MTTRTKTLEHARGRGLLSSTEGGGSLDVVYTARVFQTMHDANGEEVPGLKDVEAHVSGSGLHSLIGKELTLVLEDGRRWECFLGDSDGALVSRGAWPEEPAR